MKDRATQRAVRNVIHNELGVSKENIEKIMTDYIDKKIGKKIDNFLDSYSFSIMVNQKIREAIKPTVNEILRNQLNDIKIDVSINPKQE